MNNSNNEAEERINAELELVTSAYSPEEAWITSSRNYPQIHRRLIVHDENNDETNRMELKLTLLLSEGYPDVILQVDASIISDKSSSNSRKLALDALPDLLKCCRNEAAANPGEEAVFAVLARADAWVENDWFEIQKRNAPKIPQKEETTLANNFPPQQQIVLGRRLIYSHHIIATSKRRAISNLASRYQLGGYAKIGWPGIIIIEGLEEHCQLFVDEIKTMRWQHLVVRGEQDVPVTDLDDLDEKRVFSKSCFRELGEDQMSHLASICRGVGLEDLFKTSMKIYKPSECDDKSSDISSDHSDPMYGCLVLVDHMNDAKNYRKWLRKAAKTAGCFIMIKQCGENSHQKLVILAGIFGDESGVKQVLKRWRTSRVDVDSKGRSCLERMMSVLIEGSVRTELSRDELKELDGGEEEDGRMNGEELEYVMEKIGGKEWSEALTSVMKT